MFVTELDTFVQKFHQLWNNCHVAHLDVDTCAGKAWVGLRVHLGHVPGFLHHRQPHPAYHNRKKVFYVLVFLFFPRKVIGTILV